MDNVVGVILRNDQNKFLFYLRDNKESIPYPGTWALLGGYVEKGENLFGALKREIKEEINYDLESAVFVGAFDDKVGNLVSVYKARFNKEISGLRLFEGQKLGYFNFEEIMELNSPKVLKDFLIQNKNQIFTE